jgi:CBS domain-containing protein
MRAADVMVRNVITTGPEGTVGEVADLLRTHRISALPVADADGKVVGVISEGDLLRRTEIGTERHRTQWLKWIEHRRADDSAIRARITHSWAGRGVVNVIMSNGTVDLWGVVDSDTQSDAAQLTAETAIG